MLKNTYFFLLFFLLFFVPVHSQVVINEFLSSNSTVNTDEDGTYQDWVELYNTGATAVNLNGYGLSDDATLPYKWTFPNVSMPAGSYLLVWCSDKNRATPGSPLHTNFKLSGADSIRLTNAGGVTVNTAPAATSVQNISYGRLPNGTGGFVFFTTVTPAAANAATGFSQILPPPTFSHEGGFMTSPFNLTLTTTIPGATIYYTLDGSEPNPTNLAGTNYNYKNQYPEEPGNAPGSMLIKSFQTLQYTAPLNIVDRSPLANDISTISTTNDFVPTYIPTSPIAKATVIRAIVVKAGAISSEVASRTFFVTPQGSNRFSLPVISLSINENLLFDYEDGIYVAGTDFDTWRIENPTASALFESVGNYYRRGIENERVGNFSYFVNGTEVVNQNVGFRIHGGSSRAFPSKSLNMYARPEYGIDKIEYPFFSDVDSNDFERLVLRNSGGDFYETMFRDALNQEICKALRVERESYQPTVTFLNGEYWGILNLREKLDNNYFKQIYGIESVDVLENDFDLPAIQEGDTSDWQTLYDYMVSNSLATDAKYNYIKTRLDPDNFMDYFIANIFLDNSDWPGTNIVFWRKQTQGFVPDALYGHDGRWRFAFHDMDDTFGIGSDSFTRNSLAAATATNGPEWPNPPVSTLFLRRMLENNTFKTQFINRFADLMNTTFLSTRITSIINSMNDVIEPEIPEHISRWEAPPTVSNRDFYVNFQLDFANARPAIQRNHIRSKFGIANNINANLNVSNAAHGYVRMNTIDIKDGTPGITGNPYPWTGIYFSNIPVTVKAIPLPGFAFSHWTGASSATTAEITITSASNFSLVAHFIPDVAVPMDQPIYFWMMDSEIPNDTPLTSLDATFEMNAQNASITYQSALAGYPFTDTHPNWGKASMERRNAPTNINYIPEANENIPFDTSDMRGLQIKQPFQNGSLQNTMIFNVPTQGWQDIKFAFAAKDENAADAIQLDYAVNSGTPVWTTTGITSTLPLGDAYQLYEIDFSNLSSVDNNANFKIRLRFTGPNMTVDNGDRVTFNNISVLGDTMLSIEAPVAQANRFIIYPNPATDVLNIAHNFSDVSYKLYTLEGRLVVQGQLTGASINVSEMSKGMYLLQLNADGFSETKKILKR